MPGTRLRAAAAATLLAFGAGCASSTLIRTSPSGAKISIDGQAVGNTPYLMKDTKIMGSTTHVKLALEGYETSEIFIYRSEEFQPGACLGGVLVTVPFLWLMGYKPEHSYELVPLRPPAPPPAPPPAAPASST